MAVVTVAVTVTPGVAALVAYPIHDRPTDGGLHLAEKLVSPAELSSSRRGGHRHQEQTSQSREMRSVSVTGSTGGQSSKTMSAFSARRSTSWRTRSSERISAGLGGTGPEASIRTFGSPGTCVQSVGDVRLAEQDRGGSYLIGHSEEQMQARSTEVEGDYDDSLAGAGVADSQVGRGGRLPLLRRRARDADDLDAFIDPEKLGRCSQRAVCLRRL